MDERDTYYNLNQYSAQGSHSAAFMAADDAATNALYQCPIHRQL